MGVEENNDGAINPPEAQPEIPEQEPIEQVFSQEPEDVRPIEPSTESEDQQRFEETARFEEETDTPKVEQKQVRKTKVTRKRPTSGVNEDKPISKLHDDLRKHSDARKKTDLAILNIRRELKDLLLVHHSTFRDLQKQMAQMHRKIATIENSRKTTNVKTSGKKTSTGKKSKKKSGQNKRRRKR